MHGSQSHTRHLSLADLGDDMVHVFEISPEILIYRKTYRASRTPHDTWEFQRQICFKIDGRHDTPCIASHSQPPRVS